MGGREAIGGINLKSAGPDHESSILLHGLWPGVGSDIQITRHTLANTHLLSHTLFVKMCCRFALQSSTKHAGGKLKSLTIFAIA